MAAWGAGRGGTLDGAAGHAMCCEEYRNPSAKLSVQFAIFRTQPLGEGVDEQWMVGPCLCEVNREMLGALCKDSAAIEPNAGA